MLLAVPFSLVGAFAVLHWLGYNLSVAVWVGIIALAGLDAETGVVMLLYLDIAYEQWVNNGQMRHRADLREVRVDVPEQRAPLAADADEADADGPAAHRSFHHRGRAHRGDSRNAGDRLEKIPTAEGHLFGREVHDSISNVAP